MIRFLLMAVVFGVFLVGGQAGAESSQPALSAAQLYNLANSFARAGKPGMAVLYYERARLLAPNDADVAANLRWVRDSQHLPAEHRGVLDRAVRVASPRGVAWLGVLGIVIAGLSLLAGLLVSRFRWLRGVCCAVGVALVGLTACDALALWPMLHAGIVIAPAAPVRVSPVPMGDSLFDLPEAEAVTIKAEHEGFFLIETRAGRTGWISNANLAPVVPRK